MFLRGLVAMNLRLIIENFMKVSPLETGLLDSANPDGATVRSAHLYQMSRLSKTGRCTGHYAFLIGSVPIVRRLHS